MLLKLATMVKAALRLIVAKLVRTTVAKLVIMSAAKSVRIIVSKFREKGEAELAGKIS
jgi:hypothetical protein